MIRKVKIDDTEQICEIYNHYILNTSITFEENTVAENEMKERIEKVSANYPWLVYEERNKVLGYAYATEWRTRPAYRNSVEVTIYLNPNTVGKGIGVKLYKVLLDQLKAMNFHAIIGGIALPNPGSIALHEKLGFQQAAHFKEVGYKFKKWVDVGYWELIND